MLSFTTGEKSALVAAGRGELRELFVRLLAQADVDLRRAEGVFLSRTQGRSILIEELLKGMEEEATGRTSARKF